MSRIARSFVSMAGAIADVPTSRAMRHLEEVVREILGHVHDVVTRQRPGFAPALSGDATTYLDGSGAWTAPAGGGGGGGVPTTRTISTTAPLSGGGDMSADRTLSITQFAGAAPGSVPTSLGGTSNFLRADGTWAAPGGGGGGLTVPQTLAIASLRP